MMGISFTFIPQSGKKEAGFKTVKFKFIQNYFFTAGEAFRCKKSFKLLTVQHLSRIFGIGH